jgi:hypothetical protein
MAVEADLERLLDDQVVGRRAGSVRTDVADERLGDRPPAHADDSSAGSGTR